MKYLILGYLVLSCFSLKAFAQTAVIPATSEDVESFDRQLDRQVKSEPLKVSHSRSEVLKETESLKIRSRENLRTERTSKVRRSKKEDNDLFGSDSRSNRGSISGKRTGNEDNAGRGDHGKPVESHGARH